MKTFLFAALSLSLLTTGLHAPLFAQDAAQTKADKQVPTPGRFEIHVASGDREKSFEHPSKALSEIGRALSRARRAREGEEPTFEAALTLNEQRFTFNAPEAALEACKDLGLAMRELAKLRMGLGDLGEIPEVKSDEQPQAANPMPKGQSKAARVAEVRRRIQIALRKQMTGGRPGRPPKRLNPLAVRKTIQKEIEKARQEGLLPSGTNPANAGGGFAAGDPREARKEAIVQALALTLGQADSVGKAEPESAENDEDNPKPEDNSKPTDEDETAAEEKPENTETSNEKAKE